MEPAARVISERPRHGRERSRPVSTRKRFQATSPRALERRQLADVPIQPGQELAAVQPGSLGPIRGAADYNLRWSRHGAGATHVCSPAPPRPGSLSTRWYPSIRSAVTPVPRTSVNRRGTPLLCVVTNPSTLRTEERMPRINRHLLTLLLLGATTCFVGCGTAPQNPAAPSNAGAPTDEHVASSAASELPMAAAAQMSAEILSPHRRGSVRSPVGRQHRGGRALEARRWTGRRTSARASGHDVRCQLHTRPGHYPSDHYLHGTLWRRIAVYDLHRIRELP